MEIMLSRIQVSDFDRKMKELTKGSTANETIIRENLSKAMGDTSSSNPALDEMRKKALNEQLDSKIQNVFEQLRTDNLFTWKQSLELASKEFTEKGVTQTMNMLPKTLLDRNDLKRTVNSLLLEENAVPKPQMAPGTASFPMAEKAPADNSDGMSFTQKSATAQS